MKHYRILSSVILAGALLLVCPFSSASEMSGTTVEIIGIETVAETSSETVNTEAETRTVEIFEATVESENEKEANSEAEPKPEVKSKAAAETGTESKATTETEPESKAAAETEPESKAAAESETESKAAAESKSGTGAAEKSVAAQGLYEIACRANTDYVLDVRHCTVRDTDEKAVQAFHSLNINQQKFYLEALPDDGQFRISVLHTGDALTALPESGSVVLSAMEHPEDRAASASQSWIIEEAAQGCCYIRTEDGLYLTLGSTHPYAGAPVVLSPYAGGFSQMWKLTGTWISAEACADTDLVNPYGEDGPYSSLRVSFLFGANTETITAEDLSAHISENEEHRLVLDPEYLDSFVAQLAAKYDTQGQPKRFRTSYGNEITLYEGDFGWKLDTEETKAMIQNCLETNQVRCFAPAWSHKGRSLDGNDGIGDSYVEVDLENQKVFLYKDGKKLLETDCVSGTASDPERDTPGGVYSIFRKVSPDVLEGPGYSEFVNYWMPFYHGYGLHDATWRSEFGGEIYKNNGSHGCINLPLEAAEKIYNTVTVGYPVVLYK